MDEKEKMSVLQQVILSGCQKRQQTEILLLYTGFFFTFGKEQLFFPPLGKGGQGGFTKLPPTIKPEKSPFQKGNDERKASNFKRNRPC